MILTGPDDQPLPSGYRWAVVNGLTRFTPCHILDALERVATLSHEFSIVTGIPCWAFAARQDKDDVAAFALHEGSVIDDVVSAHLSWTRSAAPYAPIERFEDFWAWLQGCALPDMADWPTETDIQDALGG